MRAILIWLLLGWSLAVAENTVLLEFSQPGCHACVTMQPVIRQLEQEGTVIRKIDASREQHLAQRYRVVAVPTYVVIQNGRETARLQGTQPLAALRQVLHKTKTLQATGAVQAGNLNARLVSLPEPSTDTATGGKQEAMPNVSLAEAIERAQAATVRIRVQENGAFGVATGTIIDTHGDEALVLTCGHVFRESKGQTPIEVELFSQGKIHKVKGQLVDYDADTRDIGLVAIRPGIPVQPVSVRCQNDHLKSGTPVFSFGCDRGADPSRRDTRVTAINKYNQHIGASNVEIAGAPTIGRSGGGLFDQQGRLVGVCNAADFEDDIGIYAGPGCVRWQLDRVDLAHLYERPAAIASAEPPAPTRLALNTAVSDNGQARQSKNHEVIIILRDPNRPETPAKVKTFDRVPAEIAHLLGPT